MIGSTQPAEEPSRAARRRLSDLGYTVTKVEGIWRAEAGALRLMAKTPLELLGLHGILAARGWAWATRRDEPDLYGDLLDGAPTPAPRDEETGE